MLITIADALAEVLLSKLISLYIKLQLSPFELFTGMMPYNYAACC